MTARDGADRPSDPQVHLVVGAPGQGSAGRHQLSFGGELEDLVASLLSLPLLDSVEDRAGPRLCLARVVRYLPRVRPGGTIRLHLANPRMRERFTRLEADLAIARSDLLPPTRDRDHRSRDVQELHALAAMAELEVGDGLAEFTVLDPARFRLNENALATLLAVDPAVGRTLSRVDATAEAPAATCRELRGATCAARQRVYSDEFVFPDSYRDPYGDRAPSKVVQHWSAAAVHVVEEGTPEPRDGTWFCLDSQVQQHFGHTMTEQLSRLWAWSQVERTHPDVRAYLFGPDLPRWQQRIFEAAGVPRDRLVLASRPFEPEVLVTASPMYVIGKHVHPGMGAVYDRVRDALLAESSARDDWPGRVFLTRSHGRRTPHNLEALHDAVRAHGFVIVRPEELDVADQVRLACSATALAGLAGSNMFSMAFASGLPVLAIANSTYHAHNERQLAALRGHDLSLHREQSEEVSERFSAAAMHSAYTVDLPVVDELLEGLVSVGRS